MASRLASREKLRADIAAAALALILKRPSANVPLREVAEAVGVDYFVVYRQFASRDDLYRAAVTSLIEQVAAPLVVGTVAAGSVRETIVDQVRTAAEALQTKAYRDLTYLRLRDAELQPWLAAACRAAITAPFERRLDAAVRRAGDESGLVIGIRPGVSGRVFRWLEGAIVAPALFPDAEPLARDELDLLRQTAVARLIAATYSVEFAEPVAA